MSLCTTKDLAYNRCYYVQKNMGHKLHGHFTQKICPRLLNMFIIC